MEEFLKGSCMMMCPKQEIEMRERERLLHRLEILRGTENNKYPRADPNKTVKCYSRSAADVNMAVPNLIRPFPVLKKTVTYLVSEAIHSSQVPELSAYNFVWDRLRSVRQDMTIQALSPRECIQLLEPMVFFHTLYGYKLCETSLHEYDPVLNRNQLIDCMKQLLICYDSLNSDLVDRLSQIKLRDTRNNEHVENKRHLMESLYILTNLNNADPLKRYLNLPDPYRFGRAKLAYNIAIEVVRQNFVKACRLAKQLAPVELCSFSLHLPHMQRRVLEIYSHAYNSKQLTFPSSTLTKCFMFNSIQEANSVCSYYGLKNCDNEVLFNKTDFQDNKLPQPKKMSILEEFGVSELIM